MKTQMKTLALSLLISSSAFAAEQIDTAFKPDPNGPRIGAWKITKAAWDENDEKAYGDFVYAIAKSGCTTVDKCIKDPKANKYYNTNEAGVFYYADCGRFPYLLRMYFAWKNGLPFSAVTATMGTPEDEAAWIDKQVKLGVVNPNPRRDFPRNSSDNGNLMRSRVSIPNAKDSSYNFYTYASFIISRTNSSNYRFGSEGSNMGSEIPDFYPVDISRNSIKAGTLVYDPNGHVAVVSEVTPEGDIKLVDGHPDNSVSRKTFDRTFERSRPAHGAGFKRWRPYSVAMPSAGYFSRDAATGPQVVFKQNTEMKDFSLVQFYGTSRDPGGKWSKGPFVLADRQVDYYEFLKVKLAGAGFKINPMTAVQDNMTALCQNLKARVNDVQLAVTAGLDQQPHPAQMPKNVYADAGDWEAYSTPGRDLKLRMQFSDTYNLAKDYITRIANHDASLSFVGTADTYRPQLISAVKAMDTSCVVTYTKSDGQKVNMNFSAALKRLTSISFDPYFCVERRWGATGSELASCQESADKADWYKGEQYYRLQTVKEFTYENDYDLQGLLRVNSTQMLTLRPFNLDLLGLFTNLK